MPRRSATAPPTFAIVSNRPDDVPDVVPALPRARLPEAWPFTGSPLRLKFTARGSTALMRLLPWLLASYLLGAMPTSYLAGRLFKGIDLREHGQPESRRHQPLSGAGLAVRRPGRAASTCGEGLGPRAGVRAAGHHVRTVRARLRADGGGRARLLGICRVQGRQGRRHRGRGHARPGAGGARRRGGGVGGPGGPHGLRLRRQHRRSRRVSDRGVADRPAGARGDALARCGGRRRDHLASPREYPAVAEGTENRFGRRAATAPRP